MSEAPPDFRTRFWAELPVFGRNLTLERLSSLVVPQTGPGGAAVFDVIRIQAGELAVVGLLGYREKLLPAAVPALAKRLRAAEDQLRFRGETTVPRLHLVATEAAGPRTLEVCEQEHLALLDLRGTAVVQSPDIFLRIEGSQPLERRSRASPFRGKAARLVRALLNEPRTPRTIRALSVQTETSYVHTFEVISTLEQQGFAFRRSPRTGVVLRDPVGLLRAWIASGERTAGAVEPFNARATTPAALSEGFKRLEHEGASAVFTLASAIPPGEELVTAIPHGIYSSASTHLVQEAFGLRKQTPHNFLLLRPEPAADTSHGGILSFVHSLPQGPAVSLPQLIVDLHGLGGRAREQSEALLSSWARSLPVVELT